jgi:hypothetical protein
MGKTGTEPRWGTLRWSLRQGQSCTGPLVRGQSQAEALRRGQSCAGALKAGTELHQASIGSCADGGELAGTPILRP